MRSFVLLALVACGGAAARPVDVTPATLPTPATYAIRLHRASKIGQRWRGVIDERNEGVTQVVGDEPRRELKQTHFDAIASVITIDRKDDATHLVYAVNELTVTVEGRTRPLLRSGQQVELTRAPKEEDAALTVDGNPATPEVRKVLASILSLTSNGKTDDDVFGTSQRQAIGSTWTIDAATAAAEMFDQLGTAARVAGEVALVSLERIGVTDCLQIRAQVRIEGLASIPGLPEGSTLESSQFSATMRGAFPVDVDLPRLSDEMVLTSTFRVRVHRADGEKLVDSTSVSRQTSTFTPVK